MCLYSSNQFMSLLVGVCMTIVNWRFSVSSWEAWKWKVGPSWRVKLKVNEGAWCPQKWWVQMRWVRCHDVSGTSRTAGARLRTRDTDPLSLLGVLHFQILHALSAGLKRRSIVSLVYESLIAISCLILWAFEQLSVERRFFFSFQTVDEDSQIFKLSL